MTLDLSLLSGFARGVIYYHCMYVTRVCIRVRGSYLVFESAPAAQGMPGPKLLAFFTAGGGSRTPNAPQNSKFASVSSRLYQRLRKQQSPKLSPRTSVFPSFTN